MSLSGCDDCVLNSTDKLGNRITVGALAGCRGPDFDMHVTLLEFAAFLLVGLSLYA